MCSYFINDQYFYIQSYIFGIFHPLSIFFICFVIEVKEKVPSEIKKGPEDLYINPNKKYVLNI